MKNTIDFNNLTRRQLSEAVGKTERTVSNWLGDGCPRKPDGKYELPAVIQWLLERESDTKEAASGESPAMERFRMASAQLKELELSRQQDRWVERSWVEQQLAQRALILKNDLINHTYVKIPDIVHRVSGLREAIPEAIQFWLDALEIALGRYSQPIEFEVPDEEYRADFEVPNGGR